MKRRYATPAQTHLVGIQPWGTDPTVHGLLGQPNPTISTAKFGVISKDGGNNINARLQTGPAGPHSSTGEFTVADNDFTTGQVTLILGENRVISDIDFIPEVLVADTAAALVVAINRLPGWAATSNGALVMVEWCGPIDEVEFYALHYGTKTNFTPFVPANGFLAMGRPNITAPELTV